jgi:hypothetical protein
MADPQKYRKEFKPKSGQAVSPEELSKKESTPPTPETPPAPPSAAPQPASHYIRLDLPSKCLVYGIDPTTIGARLLKGKDEKLIAELTYDNFDRKFIAILRNVVTGIDPKDLTVGDRLYLMLWEAINSYSKMCDIETQCGSCFQKVNYQVDLSTLAVIELPGDFKEPHSVTLSNGDVVKLRLFRAGDEDKISEVQKAGYQTWLYRYALSIIDDKKSDWDKVAYLEELDTKDLALIRAFHEKYYHGPKMEVVTECPKCGVSEVTPVPFRLEYFFPYGKTLRRYFGDAV